MAVELILTPEFAQDLIQSASWYDQQRDGLGDEFVDAVNSCVDSIAKSPTLYERLKKNYRRALVHRFPYAVYYEFIASTIVVYAVIHTSRHSRQWRKRLR